MTTGRGKPTKAISHRMAPNEKNQNSSPAQSLCVTVARAKTVKNVWLRMAQSGRRKIATTNFTHRVGIIHASPARWRCAGGAYDAILRRRGRLRPWCKVDFRFFAAKVVWRLRRWTREVTFFTPAPDHDRAHALSDWERIRIMISIRSRTLSSRESRYQRCLDRDELIQAESPPG